MSSKQSLNNRDVCLPCRMFIQHSKNIYVIVIMYKLLTTLIKIHITIVINYFTFMLRFELYILFLF